MWAASRQIKELGAGSFARVVLVDHDGDLRAVKLARIGLADAKLMQRITDEVRILREYRHPNVVAQYGTDSGPEGYLAIFLEFCDRGDLRSFLRSQPHRRLPESVAKDLMVQLVSGMAYLWSKDCAHRDLKPANLLLCGGAESPVLKIADFGLAKLTEKGVADCTKCGSPLYMAPEVLLNYRYDAKRADVWSIGAIFVEMVSSSPPYLGADEQELIQAVLKGKIVFPHGVHLSPPAKQLINLTLRKSPKKRVEPNELGRAPFFGGLVELPENPAISSHALVGSSGSRSNVGAASLTGQAVPSGPMHPHMTPRSIPAGRPVDSAEDLLVRAQAQQAAFEEFPSPRSLQRTCELYGQAIEKFSVSDEPRHLAALQGLHSFFEGPTVSSFLEAPSKEDRQPQHQPG